MAGNLGTINCRDTNESDPGAFPAHLEEQLCLRLVTAAPGSVRWQPLQCIKPKSALAIGYLSSAGQSDEEAGEPVGQNPRQRHPSKRDLPLAHNKVAAAPRIPREKRWDVVRAVLTVRIQRYDRIKAPLPQPRKPASKRRPLP